MKKECSARQYQELTSREKKNGGGGEQCRKGPMVKGGNNCHQSKTSRVSKHRLRVAIGTVVPERTGEDMLDPKGSVL